MMNWKLIKKDGLPRVSEDAIYLCACVKFDRETDHKEYGVFWHDEKGVWSNQIYNDYDKENNDYRTIQAYAEITDPFKLSTMSSEERIVEVLKQFEQQDYKRGGASIDPNSYHAIARMVTAEQSAQLKSFLLFIQDNAPNYRTKQLKPDQVVKAYLESL